VRYIELLFLRVLVPAGRLTRVVTDKRQLNGCCYVAITDFQIPHIHQLLFSYFLLIFNVVPAVAEAGYMNCLVHAMHSVSYCIPDITELYRKQQMSALCTDLSKDETHYTTRSCRTCVPLLT